MKQVLFGMLQNSNAASLNMFDCERRQVAFTELLLKISLHPSSVHLCHIFRFPVFHYS